MQEKVSIMCSWQASSPPMLHYALGMDFPIHTRNTWKIFFYNLYNFDVFDDDL